MSADSSYADRIEELRELTFLTNSDAHSPYPIRLAREFNRFQVEDTSFDELKAAIERKRGRRPVLNVGVPPAEGKYNESACIRCYKHYPLTEAIIRKWRCACGIYKIQPVLFPWLFESLSASFFPFNHNLITSGSYLNTSYPFIFHRITKITQV